MEEQQPQSRRHGAEHSERAQTPRGDAEATHRREKEAQSLEAIRRKRAIRTLTRDPPASVSASARSSLTMAAASQSAASAAMDAQDAADAGKVDYKSLPPINIASQ